MDGVIEKRIVIHAKPETVYRALTEPRYLAKWLADRAEAKPVAGGSLLLYSGVGETAKGVDAAYTELVPGRTVRFRWIARILGGQKSAERGHHENAFLIVESPDGVIVTMRDHESPPPTDPERMKTEQGWDQVLVALKTLCEGPEAPGKEPPPADWSDVGVIAISKSSRAAARPKGATKKGKGPKPARKAKKAKRAGKAKKAKKRPRPARRAKAKKRSARRAPARGGRKTARKGAKRAARKPARRKAARKSKPKKKTAKKAKRAGARRRK